VRAPDAPGAGSSPPSAGERVDDVIVRSVELGYRVIDDYIKRGQAAARRMQHGTYGAGDMARDAQGVAGQLVRSAADLAGAWAELFALGGREANGNGGGDHAVGDHGQVVPSPSANGGARAAAVAAPPAPPAAPTPDVLRVRLRVTAARPVETALEIRPVPADHVFVAHALRGPGAARIDDVRVATEDGTTLIGIQVSATHPPGHYTGLVFDDATNMPVGEVTVVVLS
jgi:hypothetical protein